MQETNKQQVEGKSKTSIIFWIRILIHDKYCCVKQICVIILPVLPLKCLLWAQSIQYQKSGKEHFAIDIKCWKRHFFNFSNWQDFYRSITFYHQTYSISFFILLMWVCVPGGDLAAIQEPEGLTAGAGHRLTDLVILHFNHIFLCSLTIFFVLSGHLVILYFNHIFPWSLNIFLYFQGTWLVLLLLASLNFESTLTSAPNWTFTSFKIWSS